METVLQQEIAKLSEQMIDMAERRRSLTDQDVVRISQELDIYMVQLQRMKMQRVD